MNQAEMQSWFEGLSNTNKMLAMLAMMHEFTIVIRSVFHDNDKENSLKVAYALSEFNHMLTSKMSSMLEKEPTYPDDVVIESFIDQFNRPELRPYAWLVWNEVLRKVAIAEAAQA
jgi:hypothetical protein